MKYLLFFFAAVSAGIVAATNLISPEISVNFERSSSSPVRIFSSSPGRVESESEPPFLSFGGSAENISSRHQDSFPYIAGGEPSSAEGNASDRRSADISGENSDYSPSGSSSPNSFDSSNDPFPQDSNSPTSYDARYDPSSGGDRASGEGGEGASISYSVLLCGGSRLFRFGANSSDISELLLNEELKDRVPFVKGAPDFKSFAFSGRMTPLSSPLSDEEVALVFYEIVSSCTPAVPIRGRLTEIEFSREGSSLTARAVVTLSFEEIKDLYRLSFLPSFATFVLFVPFEITNSEISVHSESIELTSDTFSLPKKLLILGCNAAFGKKDYQDLFGKAIENVFINAGIFSSS